MNVRTQGAFVLLASATFLSCTGEPIRSSCEAYCDWAVACHETEREIVADAMRDSCLEATRAKDDSCAKAEAGELDPATEKIVTPCVDAIDAKAAAGECDAFVGTIDQIKQGTPPGECASSAGAFDETRQSTQETGADLCQRTTDTFCQRTADCIIGDLAIPQEVIDVVGEPFDLCVERMDAPFTGDCVGNDLYSGEENLEDVNTTRQSARECLRDFAAVSCDALLGGNPDELPEFCVGAFSSQDQLIGVATALFDLAQEYQSAVP